MPANSSRRYPPELRERAVRMVAEVREGVGDHSYDGRVQDLSRDGVAAALARLGQGEIMDDPHDEAHLAAWEDGLRWHRRRARSPPARPRKH